MSVITAIGTAVPENHISQPDIAVFMLKAMNMDNVNSRKLRTVFNSSGIDFRHSVLSDYGKQNNFEFFHESFDPFPSTEARLDVYKKCALGLSLKAVHACLNKRGEFDLSTITHLIVVSCTGMYAPGLDIDLVRALGLRQHVERTAINFMGCYAAFNALKAAQAFCASQPNAKVLVVCTEICSIHFQREPTEDNMLANALFGDGSAALLVEQSPMIGLNLSLTGFHNILHLDASDDMAWSIGNLGFKMKLSSYVPQIIKSKIVDFVLELCSKNLILMEKIKHFAIHPGGKKILEAIRQELSLSEQECQPATDVLRQYGNMSSATVLFVLEKIINGCTMADLDSYILGLAFGPGLTFEGMILKIVSA